MGPNALRIVSDANVTMGSCGRLLVMQIFCEAAAAVLVAVNMIWLVLLLLVVVVVTVILQHGEAASRCSSDCEDHGGWCVMEIFHYLFLGFFYVLYRYTCTVVHQYIGTAGVITRTSSLKVQQQRMS